MGLWERLSRERLANRRHVIDEAGFVAAKFDDEGGAEAFERGLVLALDS